MKLIVYSDDDCFHNTKEGIIWLEEIVSKIEHPFQSHQAFSFVFSLKSNL